MIDDLRKSLQSLALWTYSQPQARAASQALRAYKKGIREARLARFDSINAFSERLLSEHGEDGVLREIFYRLGSGAKQFVEFGAADGEESNTALLGRYYGWGGALFEFDAPSLASLHRVYAGRDDVRIVEAMVTRENVVSLFEQARVPKEPDLLSIDVDGNDYWIWGALDGYRPRVAVIEYNPGLDPSAFWTIPYDANFLWKRDRYYGTSVAALAHLAQRKGYALIGCEGGRNAFFVRRDLLAASGFRERTPEEAFVPASDFVRLLPPPDGPAITSPEEADRIERERWGAA